MSTDSGTSIRLGGPRQKIVLASLLLGANRVVTVDRLLESAWSTEPPPSAAVNVRGHIAAFRRLLHRAGEPEDRLSTRSGGYLLRIEPHELDLFQFLNGLHRGTEEMTNGRMQRAADHFLKALEAWQGRPLEGLSVGTSLQGDLERLEELRLLAVERHAQVRLDLGQSDALVPELRSLTRQHPFRERLWEILIVALHRMHRQADALAAYAQVRNILAEELGIDPMHRLRCLEAQILRGDQDVRVPAAEFAQPLVGFPHG
jgi:DNA-binding SARP family transcriptional activator